MHNILMDITSLADNELSYPKETEIKTLVEKDDNLKQEYLIQKSVKELLKSKYHKSRAPEDLRNKIHTLINQNYM